MTCRWDSARPEPACDKEAEPRPANAICQRTAASTWVAPGSMSASSAVRGFKVVDEPGIDSSDLSQARDATERLGQ